MYYKDHIRLNSRNSSEIWKTINEVLSRNTKTKTNIDSIKTENCNFTDAKEISEILNDHFTEIRPKLASGSPRGYTSCSDYITKANSPFHLKQTSPKTILDLLKSMSAKKATSLDNIPSRLVKEAAPVICKSLATIFNKSVDTGIFPTGMKLAKVPPIHKANDKDNLNNFRPISVLSAIAKVFERIVFNQFYTYLNQNNLLSKFQSGFRPFHSTATALGATTEWLTNMDKGLLNSVTFLDFLKAFDMIDHAILLHKLSLYGVADNTLDWFKSYFTNRQQRCYVNGELSSLKYLT